MKMVSVMGLFDRIFGHKNRPTESAPRKVNENLSQAMASAEANFHRGNALLEQGNASGALLAFQEAINLKPDSKSAHYNMGHAHFQLKAFEASILAYKQAIAIDPDFALAHVALGLSFEEIGQTEPAVSCYESALKISPNDAKTYANLGTALSKLCRVKAAVANFKEALRCDPQFTEAHSNLLLVQNFLVDTTAADAFDEAKRYGELVANLATPFTQWNSSPEIDRRLRIGFVSGDLRAHPVGYFIEGTLTALRAHAADRLDLFAYYNHAWTDPLTDRIQPNFHTWRSIFELSANEIAEIIHDDAIDVLIDLSGHTANNRLPVFAWKPAPVQVSWLGYFATTGVTEIDYLIADPWTLPEHCDQFFTEQVWRLPETRLCFTPPSAVVPVSPLPAIANGYVTFGCMSNLVKLNDSVVSLWSRILASLPDSRLFLMAPQLSEQSAQELVFERFLRHGITKERLHLQGPLPRAEYLAQYRNVDIVLDTFPYTGGTTTAEALWMGVPVLTLAGNSLLANQGVGLLMNAGLPQWIAANREDYVAKAKLLAGDLPSLITLRGSLRQLVLHSPIFDAANFAVNFEAALRGMWKEWCDKPEESLIHATRLLESGSELESRGENEKALSSYEAAIALWPSMARAHFNMGNILLDRGANAEALAAYSLAAKYKPDSAGTHYNMGNALLRLGSLDSGIDSLKRAINLKPDFADAHLALGVALMDKQQPAQAVSSFSAALNLKPKQVEALHKRGIAYQDLNEHAQAVADFEEALALDASVADIHSNLGSAFVELNRLDDAINSYSRALRINPNLVDVHYNLGLAHQNSGSLETALTNYHHALAINPDHVSSLNNLGGVFVDIGRHESALQCFRQVCRLEPENTDAHLNLGIALATIGQSDAAMQSFRQALILQPKNVDAMLRLAGVLVDVGEFQQALKYIRRGLELKPDYPLAHSHLLFVNNFVGDQSAGQAFEDAKRFGAMVQRDVKPYDHWKAKPDSTKKMRIGLVSGDLCNHPVGYFIDGVLNALATAEAERVEVFTYLTRACSDPTTDRIRESCRHWSLVSKQSDEALARQIHNDGIDILIDLSGHTAHNRLPVFAWKPAPVQVSWLGYFATTGVPTMDYLIADDWTLLRSQERFFTERIWRLPESRLCFTEPEVEIPVEPLPALSTGHITFGCFNNLSKMNDAVVELWSRVLNALPDSRLFLKSKQLSDPAVQGRTTERFATHGISANRLIYEGSQPRDEFFAAYHRVDIALDPFPYTGGTTTAEALWMGVPVLTLAGESFLSRQGVGLLMNAGFSDWVAKSPDDYVNKAMRQATDVPSLVKLRASLRRQVLDSPIYDAESFARHFVKAMRAMWTIWCKTR